MSFDEILHRARGEFLEMPGLRLTVPQARRLWNLETSLCESLLSTLVESLPCAAAGRRVRSSGRISDS